MLWLRTEPNALRLADDLLGPADANLPHFRPPAVLERLVAEAKRVEAGAATIGTLTGDIPYGPAGEMVDEAVEITGSTLSTATAVNESAATILSGPIDINRAWLARTAGRGLVTSGDLAISLWPMRVSIPLRRATSRP
jgi:hypothetical protein